MINREQKQGTEEKKINAPLSVSIYIYIQFNKTKRKRNGRRRRRKQGNRSFFCNKEKTKKKTETNERVKSMRERLWHKVYREQKQKHARVLMSVQYVVVDCQERYCQDQDRNREKICWSFSSSNFSFVIVDL